MMRSMVCLQTLLFRLRERCRDEHGGIDDLLLRGLFVVAVLGIAGAVIAYFTNLNDWIGTKLQDFMNTH